MLINPYIVMALAICASLILGIVAWRLRGSLVSSIALVLLMSSLYYAVIYGMSLNPDNLRMWARWGLIYHFGLVIMLFGRILIIDWQTRHHK